MSLLDRIAACNNGDPSNYLPFFVSNTQVGLLRRPFADRLLGYSDVFVDGADNGVALSPSLSDPDERSSAVAEIILDLHEKGVIRRIHGEQYAVGLDRTRPLMQIDRASAPYFGVRAWGVHMNGFVRTQAGLKMWIARRAKDKPNYPGMLDNMVAGGQPAGLGLKANLVKECAEEAGIPGSIADGAIPVGHISYLQETRDGIKPDIMLVYDLELPADFIPTPCDGEVDSFELMPLDQVADIVRDHAEFKPNCALVVTDFLIRHGVLTSDNEPDYFDLVVNLRR